MGASLKVGIDLRGLRGDSAYRGLGTYTKDLVEGLSLDPSIELVRFHASRLPAKGIGVEYRSWADPPADLLMRIPKVRSLSQVRTRYFRRLESENEAAFRKAIEGSELDVLHLPTALHIESCTVGPYACKTVRTFLDMIPLHVSSIYDSWIPQVQDLYRRQLEALKSADAVVAISEDARRDAIQLGVESGRVHVVYPGVSPAFGQPVSTARLVEVRTKFGLPDRYFVFCSVLEEYKNWRRMLRVFGKARTLPLVMITSKTNHWYPVLLEEIRLLGLSDDEVLVTGHVSDEELQVIVGSAWATVVPSLYEGFGLPAAQSIEAGVPVVGSNRTSIPEVVQDAGILFEPEDDDAFLKAVGEMSDSTVREQTAELARQQKGRFSRERIAHELVSVYGSL